MLELERWEAAGLRAEVERWVEADLWVEVDLSADSDPQEHPLPELSHRRHIPRAAAIQPRPNFAHSGKRKDLSFDAPMIESRNWMSLSAPAHKQAFTH